jgi:hypothetical protein
VRNRRSKLTDWLFLERYVSIVWTRRRVRDELWRVNRVEAPRFVGEKGSSKRRCCFFTVTRSLQKIPRRVKFKLSIVTIQLPSCWAVGGRLLRISFELVVQNNGFRYFLHGFAHLLALALHGAIRFGLADFQLPLQNALGAFHKLSGFQLA